MLGLGVGEALSVGLELLDGLGVLEANKLLVADAVGDAEDVCVTAGSVGEFLSANA
jgi:hypothetical protein